MNANPTGSTSLLSTFVNEMRRARERETTRRKFTPMKEKQTEESVNNVGQKGNFVYVYIAVSTSHGPNINISTLRASTFICWVHCGNHSQCTVCPGSSDPFYIVSYYIKWVTTFWTYCTILLTALLPGQFIRTSLIKLNHAWMLISCLNWINLNTAFLVSMHFD